MPLSEWGLEDMDNEVAEGPATAEQSSESSSAPSTAQVLRGLRRSRGPTRSEVWRKNKKKLYDILKECVLRWRNVWLFEAHQEYLISYERIVMERSRRLSDIERAHRTVGWARLFGEDEEQRPLARGQSRYSHVTPLIGLRRLIDERGNEGRPGE